MILALNYRELTSLIDTTNRLGNELNQYCDNLSSNVQNALYQVEGGMSSSLNSADYYVKSKITKLREKESNTQTLANKTENLLETAMTVDLQVARIIENNQRAFFKKNLDLKPSSFSVAMYSFWSGLTNMPVFGEGIEDFADTWMFLSKEIRYWWECNGGKDYFHGEVDTLDKMTLATLLLMAGGSAGSLLANLIQIHNVKADTWPDIYNMNNLKDKIDEYEKYMTSTVPEEQEAYKKWRDLYIKRFEQENPQYAKKLDELFKDMANDPDVKYLEDINNIKCIAYQAEEPYQTLFFEYLDDMHIADYNYTEPKKDKSGSIVIGKDGNPELRAKQFWSSSSNQLTLNFDENFDHGLTDPRGPYTVFFHEVGHGIDDLSRSEEKNFLWFKTGNDEFLRYEYKNAKGQTLNDVMIEDVRNKLTEEVNLSAVTYRIDLTESERAKIVDNMMAVNSPQKILDSDGQVNKPLTDVYDDVKDYMDKRLHGAQIGGISDSYGGVTNHAIEGNYKHGEYYWYDKAGDLKRTASTEFFAHNFAYNMTDSEAQNLLVEEFFPIADEFMNNMVSDVEKEIKGEQ